MLYASTSSFTTNERLHDALYTSHQRTKIPDFCVKKAGHSLRAIARVIGCHYATISRELRRNRGLIGYRPKQANQLAQQRRVSNTRTISDAHWAEIEERLREDWSPEQIAGRLGLASHERIYQHVYEDKRRGGEIYKHLRCQKQRRKRYGSCSRRGLIKNRISIDERPEIVAERVRTGDWEADTIIGKGKQQAIVSLVERCSGYTLLGKVMRKTAEAVSDAMVTLLDSFKEQHVHTITADNGREFAWHEKVSEALDSAFYFAHTYASWERGSNENANGLVRQYFPKNKHFEGVEDAEVIAVMNKLNHRPRKRLGFRTPHEVFYGHTVALQT